MSGRDYFDFVGLFLFGFVVSGWILTVSVLVRFHFLARWEVCRLYFCSDFIFLAQKFFVENVVIFLQVGRNVSLRENDF